ncbi:gamma-glutamylcyclotransferase [Altererythrobacter sp. B11]|uniref:gamma-glutamylcyclotransferase family protein n=1 Tax=Altererythrobacter sp. B11 TaxID=2060312 RepID=UPI000DC71449|nr:gamma-glutamylcyclotransferase family protein [Altererythrobacter sp. B11]BBC71568.1 gamma-glutamylcyclotransferase [Altererythrobacter sp. B11]
MQLFVYGVLIRELARGRAAELIAALDDGVPATVRGTLYALNSPDGGWYPILLPDPHGAPVHGIVHEAGRVDWLAMDEFEDAHGGPDAEYERRDLPVTLGNGFTTSAFAYCYVRDLPADAMPIPHGDFGRWLRETGHTAIEAR